MWETDLSGLAYLIMIVYALSAIALVVVVTIVGFVVGAMKKQAARGARIGLAIGIMAASFYALVTPDLWHAFPAWTQIGIVALNAIVIAVILIRRNSNPEGPEAPS